MAVIHDVIPAFELFQPESTGDAVTLLNRYSSNAWVMAGGMDSFDWLKDRIKRPSVVIDLSRVQDLRGIKESPPYLHDGRLLTLEDTVEFFNLVLGLKLTHQEKSDLVAFMRVL